MSDEIVWKPPFEPPEAAEKNFGGVDHTGMMVWRNRFNGFVVAATHFTSDPDKRTKKWYNDATRNMRYDQIQREMEIDFTSRAGERAFPFLEQNRDKYLVPDIPLDQIPKHWRIIAGLDYGSREPTAIGIYGIDEYRRFTAIMEFYKPSHYKEIAKFLKGTHEDFPHPLWNRIEKVVADPSIFRNDQENPMAEELQSRADLLRTEGIWNLVRGTNERLAGLERVRDMLAYYPNSRKAEPKITFMQRCEKGWWELTNLLYAEIPPHLLQEKNQTEDVKQKNDHWYDQCFCSGTIITTNRGSLPIEEVMVGDLALTREGYRPVTASGKTGTKPTLELKFSNGSELICTGNHPIFTVNRGFVSADELSYDDMFLSEEQWSEKKASRLTESYLRDTQIRRVQNLKNTTRVGLNSSSWASFVFTEKFGKALTGKFQRAIIFITKMETRLIMIFPTLSASLASNTGQNIGQCLLLEVNQKQEERESQKLLSLQKYGMARWLAVSGTESTPRKYGKIEGMWKRIVANADNLFASLTSPRPRPCSAAMLANLQSAENQGKTAPRLSAEPVEKTLLKTSSIGKRPAAERVVGLSEKRPGKVVDVYNLSVADCPEYFANGILVHNCRYALMSVEAPSEKPVIDKHNTQTLDLIESQLDQSARANQNEDY
jgi:hypothetical protein